MGGEQSAAANLEQWYILRGDMKYGPYEYRSMISMIQNAELQDYNYAWAPHLENWTLVGELPEFSKDRLARLIQTKDHLSGAFIERKFPRRDLKTPIYAHNDHSFFDGHTLSVSENGALVLLNDPLLYLGQKIMLHFRSSDVNPVEFNVLCEIVRKNYSKQRLNVKSGLHYAVRFLQVPEAGSVQLTKWARGGGSKGETNGILKVHE
ncbi:PilZ domain-containing protein [Bdellovibrio sp. HCB185ZH]|uniref:PilZ domain-containing protein n=1 Tax=Bdellovibrio TaxID=958 RepID=UPI0011590D6D|nr:MULTISPECIES: PilZ domain-containing protein [unclassified Bdellovibrio]QDK45087.1 PilZ domain-containing protein [Bdellovibrio sp. ZAP7]QLY26795.1 PilZ domain-containing protein [Bdellovibrio sp. KM01]